jgi:hypothetical protein
LTYKLLDSLVHIIGSILELGSNPLRFLMQRHLRGCAKLELFLEWAILPAMRRAGRMASNVFD